MSHDLVTRLGRRGLSDLDSGTIVVVPSLSFPPEELRKIAGIQFYEERLLFVLLMLDRPDLRVVFVTSHALDPAVVDYYLRFVRAPDARSRLTLVALSDLRQISLSRKLLESQPAIDRLRRAVEPGEDAYVLPFNVTDDEVALARSLDLPLYGPALDLVALGSKSGGRRVARSAGVRVPDGAEDLYSLDEVETALVDLARRRPDAGHAVVKLNEGFSGQGNAIVSLSELRSPVSSSPTVFCAAEESWASFGRKLGKQGGVVEELIRVPRTVSPSVQLRIAPNGAYEAVSTHDQILGGPDDQVYLGCRFPADPLYRLEIQRKGLAIAEVLAAEGVIGSFGVDFVVAIEPTGLEVYLSEINLRMGGTTHPFFMAKMATDAVYRVSSGELLAGDEPRAYVSSDNLKSERLAGLSPPEVIDAVDRSGLAFDPATRTGTTLHLLGALPSYGKMGAICIASGRDEAQAMYEELEALLVGLRARGDPAPARPPGAARLRGSGGSPPPPG